MSGVLFMTLTTVVNVSLHDCQHVLVIASFSMDSHKRHLCICIYKDMTLPAINTVLSLLNKQNNPWETPIDMHNSAFIYIYVIKITLPFTTHKECEFIMA